MQPSQVSGRSLAGLLYLVLVGTVVAFAAYMWLLDHVAPSRVATYAFVNPVVAVLIGWAIAGEQVSATTMVATAVIVAAVAVAVTDRSSSSPRRQVVIDSAEPVSPVAERGA